LDYKAAHKMQPTEIDSIFGVEAGHVDEVDAAANDVAGRERRPVWLTTARRTERVAIITVVAKRALLPAFTTSKTVKSFLNHAGPHSGTDLCFKILQPLVHLAAVNYSIQ